MLRHGAARHSGLCTCSPGWTGRRAAPQAKCHLNCSSHGVCLPNSVCACKAGFEGVGCEIATPCPSNCTARGTCVLGKCACKPGYFGEACQKVGAPAPGALRDARALARSACPHQLPPIASSRAPGCSGAPVPQRLLLSWGVQAWHLLCDFGFNAADCGGSSGCVQGCNGHRRCEHGARA